MKLNVKKSGAGYISSYTLNISLSLARNSGWVDENGSTSEVELIENGDGTVTIKKLEKEHTN